MGILAFDTSFIPTVQTVRKLEFLLYEACEQPRRIPHKGHKIFVLDTTYYPAMGSSEFHALLRAVFLNDRVARSALDGVALFSYDPAQVKEYILIKVHTGCFKRVRKIKGFQAFLPTLSRDACGDTGEHAFLGW